MFSFTSNIRYSECDAEGRLSWVGLLDLFQDCSAFQSETLGVGVDYLKDKRRAWVLNYWQVRVNRFPAIAEEVEVSTVPYEIKGFFGLRNFILRSKGSGGDGELPPYMRIHDSASLAYANSVWTFLDLDSMRPTRVTEPWLSAYKVSERIPMEYTQRKIAVPKDMLALESFPIRRHHLDTNGHVNNARYVQMAFDALDETGAKAQGMGLRVEYRKAAYLDDVIFPQVKSLPDEHKSVVALCDEEGKPYAVVEISE